MSWSPLNLTVRVGCNLAYETTVQTPVLFVLARQHYLSFHFYAGPE